MKKKKKRGRPPGSKNQKKKKIKEKQNRKDEIKKIIISKDPVTNKVIKPVKYKPKKLILNTIYKDNKKFFLVNKTSGFISRWIPGREKIPFNEKSYIILNKFPDEKQYYEIITKK